MLSSLRHCIRTMSTGPSSTPTPAFNISKTAGVERQLKPSEVDFMRLIEKQNVQRVTKLRLQRKRNVYTGLIIGGTVISIYLYSMLAVKQERFLDDFNEPQKVSAEDAAAH